MSELMSEMTSEIMSGMMSPLAAAGCQPTADTSDQLVMLCKIGERQQTGDENVANVLREIRKGSKSPMLTAIFCLSLDFFDKEKAYAGIFSQRRLLTLACSIKLCARRALDLTST